MKNFSKNLIWILLAFLAISLVFSLLGELDFQEPEKLSMNEVAEKIVKGEVKSITVAGNELDVVLNNDAEAVSRKETETGLTETLKNYGVSAEALQQVNITFKDQGGFKYWAGVLLPILLPLIIIIALFWWIFRRAKGGMNQAMSFSKPNLKLSSPSKTKTTFDDVANLKESKEELREIIDFLKNPQKFLKMGAKIPRGILLMGRPGTGKTLLARAVAGESRVPFFHISASEFVEMFVGVGASVSEDTPVLIKNKERIELKPISEVVDKYYEKDEAGKMKPVKGIKTLGFKPLNSGFRGESNHKQFFGGSQWSSVEGVYRHKVNELYKIHFLGGTIKTTGDHSVFVRDGNMIRAKEVRELKTGDKLVNLPFKVRSKFVPGIGTTHKVRAHEFKEEEVLTIVDLYDEEYKLNREKYEYALSHAGTHSQKEIGSHIGVSQAAVGKWQNGSRRPQFLSNNLITAGTPRRLKVNEKLMYLLGLYTAEGRTAQYYTQFVLGLHEKELQKKCIQHISNIFNIEPHTKEIPETNSYRITISSPIVAKFFDKHCGTGSKNKHIPEMLWSLSKEHFLAYLRGYTDGDGYTTKEGKLSAVSVSKQLITELTWLSSMHGIKAGVRKTVFPAGRKIRENRKPLPETTAWNLIISKSTHPFIKKHQHPFQFKKPIVQKIEKEEYDGYVYDLCGCDNEAFFGGEKPVLFHNSRVRNVFETAKKAAPSIIFIDEIDAIGRQRGAGIGGGHDEREQTLNQILSEMDGFDKETNVIVLGSTNRPDILDQALLRPGRFDRQVVLDMPDINGREQILQIHSKKKPLADDVDLKKVAVRTPGFSGADLENLMNEAAILAARNGQKKITHEDVLSSIEKVMLGPERKSRVINEEEKKIVAYHEAGHALVAAGIKEADPVQKISIISRGLAGGYTIKLPTEDRRLKTKSKFVAEIAIALGGYMSETMEFGDITTGSSNDIKKSTELVRKLVTQYGMSDKLGPRTFGKTDEMVFLGREISHERDYSEEVAEQIDEEVDKFIQKGLKITQKILKKNKKLLDKIAKTLMEKETIEQEGFNKIIKDFKLKPISVS